MNPFLRRLGFGPTDRVVVIHADDVGMCQATIPAARDVLTRGVVSSASIMVPCSWFPAAAALARALPQADFGVHLTLTSEWSSYRWRPVTSDAILRDEEGYLPRLRWLLTADAPAVVAEARAQIDHALRAGIDLTHLDAHMLTMIDPRYVEGLGRLGREYGVPVLLVRTGLERHNFDADACRAASRAAAAWEGDGLPLFDALDLMGLEMPADDRVELMAAKIAAFPRGGLSMLLLHPAVDTPELRAIARDWPARVADYEASCSQALRDRLVRDGTSVIGYRLLRDEMRRSVDGFEAASQA